MICMDGRFGGGAGRSVGLYAFWPRRRCVVEDACNDGASDEPSTSISRKGSGKRRDDYLKASSPMVEEHDSHGRRHQVAQRAIDNDVAASQAVWSPTQSAPENQKANFNSSRLPCFADLCCFRNLYKATSAYVIDVSVDWNSTWNK